MCVAGPRPLVSKGTLVTVPLVEELEDDRWQAVIAEQVGKKIKLSVISPPTAHIGRYELVATTTTPDGCTTTTHKPENDIYMLFNPWCEGKRSHTQRVQTFTSNVVMNLTNNKSLIWDQMTLCTWITMTRGRSTS